ncbi:hypothetical protein N1031_07575 [Herbiconiux moechotypicola]|uniref:Large exoprotein n=1 Tax=Herbiconiux moechotypicola TaxID=637393 RepID=A0ABN3DHL1_9MICO|nr:hypothetical protein [Herbiconiux moechotypicola]MCS5729618.1 hypothetical protein [Herbiconiux moechotypicola]
MTTDWLSGGFIIALAAVLWLVYLVPSWFRSRQYLATERNAVRLQQTLRILAETAEVPEEVRVEANARSIAEQERILKHRAAERAAQAVPAAIVAADRIRRSRAVTSVVLALSVVVAVLGGVQLASNGTWLLIAVGGVVAVGCVVMLATLARAGRRLRVPLPEGFAGAHVLETAPDARSGTFVIVPPADAGWQTDDGAADHAATADRAEAITEASLQGEAPSGWVPVSMPRPAYLSRGSMAPFGSESSDEPFTAAEPATVEAAATPTTDAAGHHEDLLRAAAEAEAALRERLRVQHETVAELRDPEPAPAPAPAPAAPPSRFAAMGILDDDTAPSFDLDTVLARRRAG